MDDWRAGVLVAAVALAVRVAHLVESMRLPLFDRPTVDAALYVDAARRIATSWTLPEVFFKPPLYPYALGTWFRVVGEDYLWLRLPFTGLGALTALLTWLVARRLFGPRVAILAGILQAFLASAVYFEGELLEVGLVTCVQMAALFAVARAASPGSRPGSFAARFGPAWPFAAGLLLGLGCVGRPVFLLFALFAVVWLGRRSPPAVAGICLVLAPVTLHNARYGRDFVLVSSNLGLNFYIGNNPWANGRIATTPELPAEPAAARRRAEELAESALARELRPSQVSGYWLRRGIEHAVTHPRRTLELVGRKFFYAWNGATIGDNEDLSGLGRYLRLYGYLPVRMWLVVPLGLVGLVAARSHAGRELRLVRGYVIAQVLGLLPFFVVERFRVPWAPVLGVFAAWTLAELVRRLGKRLPQAWRLAAVTAAALVVCNLPAFGVRDAPLFDLDYKIAYAYHQQGESEAALQVYRAAVRRNPRAALVRNGLGYLLAERGESLDEAARLIEEAIALDPAHTADFAESLAFAELRRGDAEAALAACDLGLRSASEPRTRAALVLRRAEAHRLAGRIDAARQDLLLVLEKAPGGETAAKARLMLEELQSSVQTTHPAP